MFESDHRKFRCTALFKGIFRDKDIIEMATYVSPISGRGLSTPITSHALFARYTHAFKCKSDVFISVIHT